MLRRMRSLVPEKYHKQLTPNYPFGCKRVVFDPGYFQALNRSNVDMEWDPISRITPTGIETKSGKQHNLDVIAFATGFDIAGSMTLDVTGVNGLKLQEYYDKEDGPTGYMGTTIPGFPNWVTIFGPNTATGHSSVIYMEEIQMGYALKLFKPVIEGKASSIVPRADSTRKFNDWVQYNLKDHVWPSCHSWYRKDLNGKLTTLWPGGNAHIWWSFRKPNWKHYEVTGANNWVRKQRLYEVVSSVLRFVVLAAGAGALTLVKTGRWDDFVAAHGDTFKDLVESLRALLSSYTLVVVMVAVAIIVIIEICPDELQISFWYQCMFSIRFENYNPSNASASPEHVDSLILNQSHLGSPFGLEWIHCTIYPRSKIVPSGLIAR
ncbi:hypothetical protein BN14_06165 [Rhizoctonia solani AG-1 IB]|uniref:Monooxygenase n=1 Tax=Thanatephorus cucumeris (strain AG1-IB / isolate 7/3/14) TaxID=1108050 RepID=M5C8J3_THACB|nr:hypothetical protein BN14_06165 [Rhizoctonia solani AG-1 IB]